MKLLVAIAAAILSAQVPTEVLAGGTDVRKLSELSTQAGALLQEGVYIAETGGARMELRVRKAGAGFEAARTYTEPGLAAQRKVYRNLRRGKDGFYRTTQAQIRGLKDPSGALLLFEIASGVDGIPNTLWIQYRKEDPNHGNRH